MLSHVEDLFVAPTASPLRGRFDTRTGVERLMDLVEPSMRPLRINLELPRKGFAGYSAEDIGQALAGHAGAQIARIDAERSRIRRLGLKELAFGVVFLGLCLVLGSTIAALQVGPDWLHGFVVEGLVIIGWIALWHPVDMLFFDRLPLLRDQRILRRIEAATVHVHLRGIE